MKSTNLCPHCGAQLKTYWPERTFLICTGCQVLVRNQEFDQTGLDVLYETSWQKPYQEISETGATDFALADQYTQLLKRSLNIQTINGMKILDFGAGRGSMSLALQRAGALVTAVEPYGFEFLNQQGIPAYRDLDAVAGKEHFDGIVSLDVVEHLVQPWKDLQKMKTLLVPGGWLLVTTPNRGSLNARLTGARWREALRPGHLMLFHPASLRRMLTGAGFENVRQLHWNVVYSPRVAVRLKDSLLRFARLDGELRFLARRPAGQ